MSKRREDSDSRRCRPSSSGHSVGGQRPQPSGGMEDSHRPLSNDVYRQLSRLNHEINNLSLNETAHRLRQHGLDDKGSVEVLRRRLKDVHRSKVVSTDVLRQLTDNLCPYYVVVDFEATCEDKRDNNYPHEIIEFPAVLVDTTSQAIVDEFHMYCRPEVNPTLSEFCVNLTGIRQEQIDAAEPFPKVLVKFHEWLTGHKLVGDKRKHKFAFVTDGPWDFSKFLFGQCQMSNVSFPPYCRSWVNLQKAFSSHYKCGRTSLSGMLQHLALEFEGRPHCGLDDSRNIARILLILAGEGGRLLPNERVTKMGHLRPVIYG